MTTNYPESDTVVIGSGPNGLAAAIVLSEASLKPIILEAAHDPGGGVRTDELTLPGFRNDTCSAIYPLAAASPFLRSLDLGKFGFSWIQPDVPLAHPFDDGTAATLERSLLDTASSLGREDKNAYYALMEPLLQAWPDIIDDIFAPAHIPKHPISLFRFSVNGVLSASDLVRCRFHKTRARSLLAGLAAHSSLSLNCMPSAGFGLLLALLGHSVGWPIPSGGADTLSAALLAYLESKGGKVITGYRFESLISLRHARTVMLDVTPRQALRLCPNLPILSRFFYRAYRYGPGVFKVDWALNAPVPWRASDCRRAGAVHLGGTFEEIEYSERLVSQGKHPQRPFVIFAQQSLFDPKRAPSGQHTGWAYCHVPLGSNIDMSSQIENQIERFAPGFKDCVLARHAYTAGGLEAYNPNFVGGDITGGSLGLRQLLLRPFPKRNLYATGSKGVYLCSAATPPGPGVHGMCGCNAAQSALSGIRTHR